MYHRYPMTIRRGAVGAPCTCDRGGFTLIELMVAVAIIALLIGILVPTFKAVTTSAKNVATQSTISVLERGLESYRGETALSGGVYPPSRTDDDDADTDNFVLKNPFSGNLATLAKVAGANLLVYAMAGADQLGTPGFEDLNKNGMWWDDQGSAPGMAYEMNPTTLEPVRPRYPARGSSYVDEPTAKSIRTLDNLEDDGLVLPPPNTWTPAEREQPFFTDSWGRPILYYRANRGGRVMIFNPDDLASGPGVYDIRDNALITGNTGTATPALDFGPGTNHYLGKTLYPGLDPNQDPLNTAQFDNTFERVIHNPAVTQRNEPVNRDTFLLISAGADALYGTSDDVVNWTRK